MANLFLAIVVLTVGYTIIKAIKNRKIPNNDYTPYDDVTKGENK